MRLCRYLDGGEPAAGLYSETTVVSLPRLAAAWGMGLEQPTAELLDYLLPEGRLAGAARALAERWDKASAAERAKLGVPLDSAKFLVPIAAPAKVILLAGNYAEH